MDKEHEDFQFLGFVGILKESTKIIWTWPKIFTKITLAFILPLACLFLANVEFSTFLLRKINNSATLQQTQVASPAYNFFSSEWITYWLVKAAYIIVSLIFSLLSISAVVYTVACMYTGKEITFRQVMSVVPKVWKQLMITFLCNFCIIFAYTFVVMSVGIITCVAIILFMSNKSNSWQAYSPAIIGIIVAVVYLLGFLYMAIIWQLANVISVMEKSCGFQAMKKSKALIKGKMATAIALFLVLMLCYTPLQLLIHQIVRGDKDVGVEIGAKFWYGLLCVVLYILLALFNLVVHTVFYFVCKSHHHENIDKSTLANHLEEYLGEYVPLKSQSIQLEHLHV